MSAFGALGPGTRVAILLLGGAVVVGGAYLSWQMTRPDVAPAEPAVAAAESEAAKPDPAAQPAPEVKAEATAEPLAEPAAEPGKPALPVIDTWRVAAGGEAVVSGSAEPGSTIEVMVDGTAVASAAATASGEFAILFTLAPNPKPSLMWLAMTLPGQDPVPSQEMVALGPIEGPAASEPAAETVPEPAPDEDAVAAAEDPAAPPALLLSDEGAVVLQDPATPATAAMPASGVVIDTIAYTPEGEVQVGGRGAAGAVLRLYLDNAEKATATIPATGLWVTTLPDTAPGIYTLRVDQLDASGKVTSRFETPFKRETLEALAAVSTPEPAAQETAAAEASAPPQDAEPVAAEPEPSATDVAAAAPATPEPPTPEPATPEPAASEPAPAEPAAVETAAQEPAGQQSAPEPVAAPAPVTVTVQPGFTLWGIAQERMGDGVMYVQVFEANKDKIKDPDLIYPGQVFTMPETAASP